MAVNNKQLGVIKIRKAVLIFVRPISKALYDARFPEDLRKEKLGINPGIIPVCYSKISKSIEDVWETERKYIEEYRNHPVKTDFIL